MSLPAQLSMLDALCPPPPTQPKQDRVARRVLTRAYGCSTELNVVSPDPDPFESEVRGIPFLIAYCTGFCTYTVQPPGSLFWSETGFRSFGYATTDRAEIERMVCRYIDAPAKDGTGCGGKLVRWWPGYVRQWQQSLSFRLGYKREELWTQWGPERHAEIWAAKEAEDAAALSRMWAEGIDPNDVGKPAHHKGRWPRFEAPA